MNEELNNVALNDEDLEAINGGGLFDEGGLLHSKALVKLGDTLSSMGSLMKNAYFGDHLVHYDD
ncbi:hypothetical protein AB4Z10_25215 [Bosea sp. RAF48]|uniref:hypothetical protein n=1 Tax=Bosea sp. RAF48 TaxID=3237480 RepID=UPI003F93424A